MSYVLNTLDYLWDLIQGARVVDPQMVNEYVLFGSTVMYLHGLREPETVGDVDIFVSRRLWGLWFAAGAEICVPRAGDPPFLSLPINDDFEPRVHAFYDWTERHREWMSVEQCFVSAEIVRGWRCISLDLLRQHKRLAGTQEPGKRAKHLADLELLDERLAGAR